MKKLIIIPAYNESEAILSTVETIRREAPDFDYLVVNDCSTDSTKQILEEHRLNFLDLPVNLGIGGAVQTGYMYAYRHGYDMAVQVDGDGQHDPAFLKTMADHLENHHCDMVIGSRFIRKEGFQSSRARRLGIQWFSWLIRRMTGVTITDPTSGLRMVGRKGMELFSKDYPRDYPEPETIVTLLNRKLKIEEIPVIMRERQGGTSSINLKKSVYYMVKVSLAILFERSRKNKC
ncbi:glycosyltransferase family 2 protein [Porcincola intestinalis]|uniref:glycosyltransferase family 2 protein n=1 Tax=Porcincola intestinalis TaxID=2606632 RepID=UPI002A9129C1|nr:glycosyltransferase family 2 protein [Porcincola intestinalis]MDY5580193.1 glycosyltransferase family 2 protein [Porcincola intestinalis]